MGARGRVSVDDLMIKESGLEADITRPDVPYDLDDESAEEWRRIVNCMPANHFIPANYHILSMLCRHLVETRRISKLIRGYCNRKDRLDVQVYLDLVKQQNTENMIILKLSRSMRLTHQSTFSQKAVKLSRIAAQTIDMTDEPGW